MLSTEYLVIIIVGAVIIVVGLSIYAIRHAIRSFVKDRYKSIGPVLPVVYLPEITKEEEEVQVQQEVLLEQVLTLNLQIQQQEVHLQHALLFFAFQ